MGIITSTIKDYRKSLYKKQSEYNLAVANHDRINISDATPCAKALYHYFEVTNNHGKTKQYTDNLTKLFKEIQYLYKSPDEQLCYNILKIINVITMDELLQSVAIWNVDHPSYISQSQMISRADDWPKIIMLGQLWLLYQKKI